MKTCTVCAGAPQPLDNYRKTQLSPDGHAHICKACAKIRKAAKATEPEAEQEAPTGPTFTRAATLGYTVCIHNGDVVIEQTAPKVQTIWLSFEELETLYVWAHNAKSTVDKAAS